MSSCVKEVNGECTIYWKKCKYTHGKKRCPFYSQRDFEEPKIEGECKIKMEKNRETVEAVKCINCGELHEVDSEDFFTIRGGLHIGLFGGIIGGGSIDNVSIFCKDCLVSILNKYVDDSSNNTPSNNPFSTIDDF